MTRPFKTDIAREPAESQPQRFGHPAQRLLWAARAEGVTLILLLFVAVPAKRLFGYPELVSVMGPIHGLVFIAYLLLLAETVAGGGWSAREIVRTALVSLVPAGPFFNDRLIARKALAACEARS